MGYIDIHTHHPSLHGETVFQQGVDNLGIHPWDITPENVEILIDEFEMQLQQKLFINDVDKFEMQQYDATSVRQQSGYISTVDLTFIGECGLDKCCDAPFELQEKLFLYQIQQSEALHLPLILHCVKSIDEVLRIRRELRPKQAWIFHGFRGKPQQLNQLLRNGFYISFGPLHNVQSVENCPLDRLFLETDDSEYDIRRLYEEIASIKGVSHQDLCRVVEESIERIKYSKSTRTGKMS